MLAHESKFSLRVPHEVLGIKIFTLGRCRVIIVAHTHVGTGINIFPVGWPKRFWESKFSLWGGPRGFVAESVVIGFGAGHSSWSTD